MNKKILKSIENWWQTAWRYAATGALLVTIPGLYIGKVWPWHSILPFRFWLGTAVLGIGSLLILRELKPWRSPFPKTAGSVRPWIRGLSILSFLLFFIAGYILTGHIWWHAGKIALAYAKSDVLSAGLQLGVPENAPPLPDEKNAARDLTQAMNAPSMGSLEGQTADSKKPFYGKETEFEFLLAFNEAAKAGLATKKEKTYARKLLKEHQDILGFADKAFEKKTVDWGLDWSKPFREIQFPPIGANFMNMARLERCRAFLAAFDGNGSETVKSIQTAFYLGDAAWQEHTLIGVMVDAGIVRMMADTVCDVLPMLKSKNFSSKELIPFMQPKKLSEGLSNVTQYEFLGSNRFLEPMDWLKFADFLTKSPFPGHTEAEKIFPNYFFGVIYWPFLLFDLASRYEAYIPELKAIQSIGSQPGQRPDWGSMHEGFYRNGWILGLSSFPENGQLVEKVREAMTVCNLARLEIEVRTFGQKNKRWPASTSDVEKMASGDWDPLSPKQDLIPDVLATGAFVHASPSPEGNKVTLAHKGEAPTTGDSGWLYDSSTGSVYVNSTVKDSKSISYSFYGFE